jgi:hypothetical protein
MLFLLQIKQPMETFYLYNQDHLEAFVQDKIFLPYSDSIQII